MDAAEGLNEQQAAAVTDPAQYLCIIAGAGSGKTRVLTRRIAHGSSTGRFDPRRVLALTFTRKAAHELTSRLRQLGLRDSVAAGTFHGVAYSALRSRWAEQGRAEPELLDRKVGFVARVLGGRSKLEPIDLVADIEWAKARRIGPRRFVEEASRQGRSLAAAPQTVARHYADYEEAKQRRGLIDFDDLLILARRELLADPVYGEAQRWRFRHLFVDEFQDVNPLQFALLEAWLGPDSDLTVVGDPRQAIYGWNGADPEFLESFTELFPDVSTVELNRNYRSTPQVLGIANAVLRHGRDLAPTRAPGPLPVTHTYPTDTAEARGIARTVRDRRGPGGRWSDQAVLVRTNAQIPLLEEALRKSGIPFRSRGGPSMLDRPDIKRLVRSLPSGQRLDVALADLEAELGEPRGETEPDSPPATDATPTAPTDEASATAADRQAAIEQFIRFGHDHLALDAGASVGGFVSWLRTATSSDDGTGGGDAVELATFHSAKGLEWPVVHIGGLEDGLTPIGYAKTAAARREERNLMYVAITRAERELHCSWAEQRKVGRRTARRTPSPFLVDIEDALAAVAQGTPVGDTSAHLESQRRALAGKRTRGDTIDLTDDDPTFVALKDWRRRTAEAANVPAFVVFHDRTLKEVAQSRPTTAGELAGISGIGQVKLTRYGDDLLAVVAATANS
ncbi:MAG: ATP-dependent DNA helicase UvrD2 [Acidimicrobiia bacterium]|nr:ATP-dependent DNA helicase UvrD2 [Acidimicrobiia bacterium]